MKIKAILTMLIMLGGACMYALPDTADAARLGGGRSFGSRPSMSQPAQAPSAMQRQSTQQRQQAAQAQQPQRKGFLGGMGGLLGGLLAGSLIGSLLFGGGFSGGGIMDILLLGIGADVIVLNQPTRGVDVGAMEFIHKKILEMRDEKKSLILVSADLTELRALSDRIIVFHQGKVAGVIHDVKSE